MLAEPQALRAATALLLLAPFIPMLFMGEEWASTTPFLFFTDHNEELAKLVREGRRAEFKHFSAFQDPAKRAPHPRPERAHHLRRLGPRADRPRACSTVIRHLLTLRRDRIVPGIPGCRSDGRQVLGAGRGARAPGGSAPAQRLHRRDQPRRRHGATRPAGGRDRCSADAPTPRPRSAAARQLHRARSGCMSDADRAGRGRRRRAALAAITATNAGGQRRLAARRARARSGLPAGIGGRDARTAAPSSPSARPACRR